MLKRQIFQLTTDTAGAATSTRQNAVIGKLYAIEYRPGTIDTGATLAVTCESDTSKPLLTKASAGTSNSWYYPRDVVHDTADGAALIGTAGGDRTYPVCHGYFKVTITSGGSTKTGSVVIYFDE